MAIDDIWRTLHKSVGMYWKGKFDSIPQAPGVYAWFYPLRVTSTDIYQFLRESRAVHLYDARSQNQPRAVTETRIGWSLLQLDLQMRNPAVTPHPNISMVWDRLAADEASFTELRKVLLAASMLMPPLYVGKAGNLRTRCHQHLDGNSEFSRRFANYAAQAQMHAVSAQDLLCVTLRTDHENMAGDAEALVEYILKLIARPPYGMI